MPITRTPGKAPLISHRFNPDMLSTAREARRLSQTALAHAIGVSQPLIGKWEAGHLVPNDEQIERLSATLKFQRDLLFVDRSKRLGSLSDYYHRALSKAKRKDVKAVHAQCSIMDLQIDRLLNIGDIPEDTIPNIDPEKHAGNVERVAMMARTRMGVGYGPVANLIEVIERCGGIVVDRDFEVEEIDALCRWVPELPKLFFVNGSKPTDRLRLSLAHELGHTVMHFDSDASPAEAESQAFEFAAAFLMPAHEIKHDFGRGLALEDLASLKRKWRVSMQALARRAHELGLIDKRRYQSIFIQLSRRGWRKAEPIEIPPETPQHFTRLVRQHAEAGYSKSEMSRLLFVPETYIEQFINEAESPTWKDDGVRLRLSR